MWTDLWVDKNFEIAASCWCGPIFGPILINYPIANGRQLCDWRKMLLTQSNCSRWEGNATYKGKALRVKPHKCLRHETRSQSKLRSKPLRGWESLKAELTGRGKPRFSELNLGCARGAIKLMRVSWRIGRGQIYRLWVEKSAGDQVIGSQLFNWHTIEISWFSQGTNGWSEEKL